MREPAGSSCAPWGSPAPPRCTSAPATRTPPPAVCDRDEREMHWFTFAGWSAECWLVCAALEEPCATTLYQCPSPSRAHASACRV